MSDEEYSESDLTPLEREFKGKLEAALSGKLPDPSCESQLESEQITEEDASVEPAVAEQKRLAKKPDTSHLKLISVGGEGDPAPVFALNERIVVERNSPLLDGSPWLDTQVYRVISADHETGLIRCLHDELGHHAVVSYKDKHHRVFRCPQKGNPFTEQAKRELIKLEKKIKTEEHAPPATPGRAASMTLTKRRGRPPGSKNRPADVIAKEKAMRAAKKSKRVKKGKKK